MAINYDVTKTSNFKDNAYNSICNNERTQDKYALTSTIADAPVSKIEEYVKPFFFGLDTVSLMENKIREIEPKTTAGTKVKHKALSAAVSSKLTKKTPNFSGTVHSIYQIFKTRPAYVRDEAVFSGAILSLETQLKRPLTLIEIDKLRNLVGKEIETFIANIKEMYPGIN